MIDLRWTKLTPGLALLFIIVFMLYVFTYYRRCVTNPIWKKNVAYPGLIIFSLCIIIFLSHSSGGDWFHYQDMVWNYDFTKGAHNHGEPIYGYIIKIVEKNYFLFRLIVWGSAFYLSCLTFKRLGLNINVSIFFLIVVYWIMFVNFRSSLAAACYFLGLSYLVQPIRNKRLLNVLIVFLCFCAAYAFHHSLLPVIMFTVAVYFPFDKPVFTISLFLVMPFLAAFVFLRFGILDSFVNDAVYSKFNRYLARETTGSNFFGQIANVIHYGTYVLPLVISCKAMYRYRRYISAPIARILRVTLSITLFAVMFLFMDLSSTVFTYRYFMMTLIPLTILSVYLYQNQFLTRRSFSWIVLWGIGSNMYDLLYGLYKTI